MIELFKKRNLKDIIDDIEITAITDGEYKYVNANMISESLEYITSYERYYEVQSDLTDEIEKIIEILNKK